jgi:MoaA/NifB/PqqE/SkfB family radical SAM enzyme
MFFNRIFLIVTEACDSRCSLCDYWLIQQPKLLDPLVIESKVVDLIRDHQISVVCISGGEPTLHPDLGRIAMAIRATGSSVTLTTSTSNIEPHFDLLRSSICNYLISLDGPDRETYRQSRGIDLFDHVMHWVRQIRTNTSAEIAISCVLQACNLSTVRSLYNLCLDIGVKRLFFRVPDLKPNSFGRADLTRPMTLRQVSVTLDQVAKLSDDIAWIIQTDRDRKILGQTEGSLVRKVNFFKCIAQGSHYEEEDQRCDVPLTSFVIDANGMCKPCFYLPQIQPLTKSPANGSAFVDTYEKILNDEAFRRRWCNSCQQFDGHKHKILTIE